MKTLPVLAAILAAALALAQAPDNSKINKRDDAKAGVTVDQQSNQKTDLELVRAIRREITREKAMSIYARNIKIITRDGIATLRGPVKTKAEKTAIEAIAKRMAGDTKVESHLEIAPAN